MIVAAAVASAAAVLASEYEVKAALLYNFAKFVEWPSTALPEASSTMELCILGEDPFGTILDQTLQGKIVNGRTLLINRYRELKGLDSCQILFISVSERQRLPQILATLNHLSVLTVSEMERFAQSGGMINFTVAENKVQFEINVGAAERAGLKISSKVLKLARIVGN
jgi:hypothetical protein